MTRYAVIHGKTVIQRGHRFFAIPRATGFAQQVAERSNLKGNWNRIESQPRGSRVIINHHR
jgi:hypothetical protein